MTVMMEVIHTIRPATPRKFANYVTRYGETAVPMMERSGFDILGAFKWSTGEIGRDLLIVRFDSMAHYETASSQLFKELAKGGLAPLMELGLAIDEQVHFCSPLPYATEERLQALLSNPPEKPRQYLYARLKVASGDMQNAAKAYEVVGKLVDEMSGDNVKLATAYATTTGMRGEFADVWALEDGVGDLAFTTSVPEMPIIDELRQVVDFEALDFINPLPYSKLQ